MSHVGKGSGLFASEGGGKKKKEPEDGSCNPIRGKGGRLHFGRDGNALFLGDKFVNKL